MEAAAILGNGTAHERCDQEADLRVIFHVSYRGKSEISAHFLTVSRVSDSVRPDAVKFRHFCKKLKSLAILRFFSAWPNIGRT